MGCGIAHVCTPAGLDVVLTGNSAEALAATPAEIARNLARGRIREKKAAALARLATGSGFADFGRCGLVIEAATENEAVKRAIYQEFVAALEPTALIASNTSPISITRLAAATDPPRPTASACHCRRLTLRRRADISPSLPLPTSNDAAP